MPGSVGKKIGRGGIDSLFVQIRTLLRRYILLDCLAIFIFFLIAWVVLSSIFDHGMFRFFGFDLVLDGPVFLRTWQKWILLGVLAAFLIPRFLLLFRPKTDKDLAMVLEKRFPGAFQETLLTSLDLTDSEKVRSSGFSDSLVRQTRMQAEGAAEQVDPKLLLTWGRLNKRLVGTGLLVVAFFPLLCGWGFIEKQFVKSSDPMHGSLVHETIDNLGFWWDRTVGGSDVAWPRTAFARVIGFATDGIRKVGKGTSFNIQVHAHRFLIAGKTEGKVIDEAGKWLSLAGVPAEQLKESLSRLEGTCENGWRPLTWFDLDKVFGKSLPELAQGLPPRAPWVGQKLDAPALFDDLVQYSEQLVLLKNEPNPSTADDIEVAKKIQTIKVMLEDKAKLMGLGRKIRVLPLPDKVTLEISENQGRSEGLVASPKPVSHTIQADGNNPRNFIHRIQSVPCDLDIRISVADHHGPARFLLAIQPTPLSKLLVREVRPGYLKKTIDPMVEGEARDKALIELASITETVDLGDRLGSRIDETELVFPAGSQIVLEGSLPINRKWGSARFEWGSSKDVGRPINNRLSLKGERELVLETPKVLSTANIRLVLEDSDGIMGERKVKLTPDPDEAPTLEVRPSDDLRETDRGFVSTAGGRIPWVGSASDKQGLGRVNQVHTVRVAREEGVAVSLVGSIGMASSSGFARLFPLGQAGAVLLSGPGQRVPRRVTALVGSAFQGGISATLSAPGLLHSALNGVPVEKIRVLPGFVRTFRAVSGSSPLNQFALEADGPGISPAVGNDFPLPSALEGRNTGDVIEYGRTMVDLRMEAEDLDVVTTAGDEKAGQPHRTTSPGVVIRIISDDDMLDLLQGDFLRLRAQVQEARDLLLPVDPSIRTSVRHLFELQGLESELRETENRLDPTRRDGESVTRLLEEVRGRGREIEQAFLRLLRQTALVGFEVKREQTQVAKMLGQLNREMIGAVDGTVEQFNRAREANAPAVERISKMREASIRARELISFMDLILDAMGGSSDLNREVTRLRGILREQESQAKKLEILRKDLVNRLLDDLLKP